MHEAIMNGIYILLLGIVVAFVGMAIFAPNILDNHPRELSKVPYDRSYNLKDRSISP